MPLSSPTGGAVPIQDEGVTEVATPSAINFVGSGVTVTEDPTGVAKVTILGGSGGGNVEATAPLADEAVVVGDGGTTGVKSSTLSGIPLLTAGVPSASNVTNDVQTRAAIVPNTAPAAGGILAGNVGGTAYAPVAVSGDATLASTGALTIANDAVTLAKMANINGTTAEVVLGRSTASSGDPELLATTGTRGTPVVLATSPDLVTPNLGTPSAGVLTNATGLPPGGQTTAGRVFSIGFGADGGGVALSTGALKATRTAPVGYTITGWNISVDTGTATVKFWKIAAGTAIPTIANVINTSGVAVSSGTHVRSSVVTDFTTTTITAGDILMVDLTAVSGATWITVELEVSKS